METNILGLPSLTGYTPLKASLKGQVLKYDFRGIGPIVVDKSGHGNRGKLMPRGNPPRRKIVSGFPLKIALALDGKNDFVKVNSAPTLAFPKIEIKVTPKVEPMTKAGAKNKLFGFNRKPLLDYNMNLERWEFGLNTPEGTSWATIGESPAKLESKHTLVLKYDGETLNGKVSRGGKEIGSDSTPASGATQYGSETLTIGQRGDDLQFFSGNVHLFKISSA